MSLQFPRALLALVLVAAISIPHATGAQSISPVGATVLGGSCPALLLPNGCTVGYVIDGDINYDQFVGFSMPDANAAIRFDLGGDYDLTGFTIWNNAGFIGGDGEGLASFSLSLFTASMSPLGSFTFSPADVIAPQSFALVGTDVRYVDMDDISGHLTYTAFHEIEFETQATPEPSTVSLIALGLIGVVLRRKRAA